MSSGIDVQRVVQGGIGSIHMKKSTAFPTTIASMNIAMPTGSFIRMSMSRIVIETAMDAVP